MNKDQAQEALIQASRIIDQWKENELESYEAMELIAPLLETIKVHFERIQDKISELKSPARGEKRSLHEDLEKNLDKEEGEPALYLPEMEKEIEEMLEDEDLFKKKAEDLEEEEDSD